MARASHYPRFNLRIPPELDDRLNAAAKEQRLTKTAAICEAIGQWLEADEPEPVIKIGGNGRASRGAASRAYGPRVVGDHAPMPEPEPPETSRGAVTLEKLRRLR